MADERERSDGTEGSLAEGLIPRAPRVQIEFAAEYVGKRVNGSGTVQNLSRTGALIEPAEPPLEPGSEVGLRFWFPDSTLAVELGAEVVRETEAGFALRFTEMDERTRNILTLVIARALARGLAGDEDDRTLDDLDLDSDPDPDPDPDRLGDA
jgi:hypothetical protein